MNLQFSNFKTPAIPNSFVAEFVAEGSIIKFTKVCFGSNEIHKGAI
jgi:hypothetical protein